MKTAILLIQCPDQPGIVAKVSQWVFSQGGNIIRSDQHSTHHQNGTFFMRLEICFNASKQSEMLLQQSFAEIAEVLQAMWALHNMDKKMRMGVLVSRYDHCLFELLYRWHSGELRAEIPFIISNQQDCEKLADQFSIPYYYFPTSSEKQQQEKAILEIVTDKTDFLVLARYMQILSPQFLRSYPCDIINIHHSFLPSFVGANPYQQAYQRGVKIIGATAHYVTDELDEGPIIEQIVERVSHRDDVLQLQRAGKHLEKIALVNAIAAHVNHQVIRYDNKTIVFDC